jgi:hypothetical protein
LDEGERWSNNDIAEIEGELVHMEEEPELQAAAAQKILWPDAVPSSSYPRRSPEPLLLSMVYYIAKVTHKLWQLRRARV